jgi:hypothetical protein
MLARRLWPWLSRGSRHAGQSSTKPNSATRPRGVLERIESNLLVGWAAYADGRIGDVEVRLDGHALPLAVRRIDRLDVAHAIGLAPEGCYGFQATLAPLIWARVPDGGTAVLSVAIDGHELPERFTLSNQSLNDWQYANRAVVAAGADGTIGAVENASGLVISGWIADQPAGTAAMQLWAGGRVCDAAIMPLRSLRHVARLPTGVSGAGFEIELPASIWRLADPAGRVELRVLSSDAELAGSPWLIDVSIIGNEADAQAMADLGMLTARVMQDPAQHQYRALLLLEHAAQAPALHMLKPDQLDRLRALSQRCGLALPAFQHDEPSIASADPASQEASAQWPNHWASVRRLHEGLLADGTMSLDAFVDEYQAAAGTEARRLLLHAAMPTLCLQGQLPQLSDVVEPKVIELLLASNDAGNLSIAMSLTARHATGESLGTLFWRVRDRIDHGWLNTECLSAAADIVLERHRRGKLGTAAVENAVYALLAALQRYGEDHRSRLNDRHLQSCMVKLLRHAPLLADYQGVDIAEHAIRLYGLQPDFWSQAAGSAASSALLREGHEHFLRIVAALNDAQPPQRLRLANIESSIEFFRHWANADAESLLCQTAQWLLHPAERHEEEAIAECRTAVTALARSNALQWVRVSAFPQHPDTRILDDSQRRGLLTLVTEAGLPGRSLRQATMAMAWNRLRDSLAGEEGSGDAQDRLCAIDDVAAAASALCEARCEWVGLSIGTSAWLEWNRRGIGRPDGAALLSTWMASAISGGDLMIGPPAAVTDALHALKCERSGAFDPSFVTWLARAERQLLERYATHAAAISAALACPAAGLHRPRPSADTLVVIYSCRKYLSTRITKIRETWGRTLIELGIPYVVLVGDGDDRVQGDVLALKVSDRYEDLPSKTLQMIDWVFNHTDFQHLYKVDDDCYVDVEKLFGDARHRRYHYYGRRLHREPGSMDRRWHQSKSVTEHARNALDKSPEPSVYADGGCGYNLSRFAMATLLQMRHTSRGQRLVRSSFMEDKLVGDLLALGSVELADHDYHVLIRRRTHPAGVTVNMWDNVFLPSAATPTVLAHLDGVDDIGSTHENRRSLDLRPAKIWPTYRPLSLRFKANQLELLSPVSRLESLFAAPVIVVAVARNESLLLPHFLAHYRGLGATHFVIVDNLSDDGSREWLLQQPDVTVYSADTEYRHSNFGVAWQEAVLGAHGLGRWAVLADVDEFLVYRGSASRNLVELTRSMQADGADSGVVLMVDMYPQGDLDTADFATDEPFSAAGYHDCHPLLPWRLGAGAYSNSATWLSALRHRLIPASAPNMYTSQKVALIRYRPWMRFAEGLHYASGVTPARERLAFAHFKYHRGFREKVMQEIARKQHFDNASEYRRYINMLSEAGGRFFDPALSQHYQGADALLDMLEKQLGPAVRA